jgi:hypothetical protein
MRDEGQRERMRWGVLVFDVVVLFSAKVVFVVISRGSPAAHSMLRWAVHHSTKQIVVVVHPSCDGDDDDGMVQY